MLPQAQVGCSLWKKCGNGHFEPTPSDLDKLMKRAILGSFANLTMPDLNVMNDEGLSAARLRIELLSGLTVALALIPEAVAFAFVAGVHPLVGLYAAFLVGLITAVIGGRPGMISGATGALAVVMVALVAQHGVEYLFATVVLMGILQIFAGVMQWGKFIRLVPHPVMLGFVNGLAIVIFLAQLTQFKVPGTMEIGGHGAVGGEWLSGTPLITMLGLVALTMGIIYIMPRVTKIIPAPLAGIGIVAAVVIGFGLDVPRVGDMASIKGGLASQECVAQGVANTVTGFFGGMGGCAMIGQSMINVRSGGRTRIAGIAAALFLLLFILVGSSIIEMIPLAALVGVMFMVVIGTFAWNSLTILRRVPLTDAFVTVLVTIVTVLSDLAVAVVVGVIVSALAYAWNNARRIHAHEEINQDGSKSYRIQGPLFFGSSDGFVELFTPDEDPDTVVVDFADSRVVDQSALQAIEAVAAKYEGAGKRIQLRHLSRDCHRLLSKAGHLMVAGIKTFAGCSVPSA